MMKILVKKPISRWCHQAPFLNKQTDVRQFLSLLIYHSRHVTRNFDQETNLYHFWSYMKAGPKTCATSGGGGQYWWDILSTAEGGVLCSTRYKVLKDSSQDGCQRIRCSRIMHDDLVGSLSGMLCVICVCGSLQILVLRWYLFWIMHPTTYLAIWVRYPKENQDINSSPNMVLFCWFAGLSLS